jgi:hypothetical protein
VLPMDAVPLGQQNWRYQTGLDLRQCRLLCWRVRVNEFSSSAILVHFPLLPPCSPPLSLSLQSTQLPQTLLQRVKHTSARKPRNWHYLEAGPDHDHAVARLLIALQRAPERLGQLLAEKRYLRLDQVAAVAGQNNRPATARTAAAIRLHIRVQLAAVAHELHAVRYVAIDAVSAAAPVTLHGMPALVLAPATITTMTLRTAARLSANA